MSRCLRCGAEFGCGMVDPATSGPCWCTLLPSLPALPAGSDASCFCPACLRELLEQTLPPAIP
ncbi:cysteine-rich CWC family protein [Actimicrobium sp. CCC2.4]|uniref:cysteine-rich CWC family protein n=1 Tax=Actimicrobium sp. CCC2.4 TaxID=3048606 RepID=UPI002AC8FF4C|nr:cysteine-rich CWC family protein [Actimicrobium sp. CCC2.4]MEB0136011.1 cysteine-rich CWC family protein [Actimicrobium sp. CCC2.4]WPX32674.1 cysteine-rich CWC family protein [Actimicrobium sp. CCC2.4]